MLNLFKKSSKKDLNCCNIKIEEVKEECYDTEKKKECCSPEDKDA